MKTEKPLPMQPLVRDDDGTIRFRQNRIVNYLKSKVSLNDLAEMGFDAADWSQFLQLIGYSMTGFMEHSMVPETDRSRALKNARQVMKEDSTRAIEATKRRKR